MAGVKDPDAGDSLSPGGAAGEAGSTTGGDVARPEPSVRARAGDVAAAVSGTDPERDSGTRCCARLRGSSSCHVPATCAAGTTLFDALETRFSSKISLETPQKTLERSGAMLVT